MIFLRSIFLKGDLSFHWQLGMSPVFTLPPEWTFHGSPSNGIACVYVGELKLP